eukprot:1991877-Amphidinium_carterae.1
MTRQPNSAVLKSVCCCLSTHASPILTFTLREGLEVFPRGWKALPRSRARRLGWRGATSATRCWKTSVEVLQKRRPAQWA